jgi:hypothetical protein
MRTSRWFNSILTLIAASGVRGDFVTAQEIRRTITTTLSVDVLAREFPGGVVFPVKRAIVCVGDSADTQRYGMQQILGSEASFTDIPLGAGLIITAYTQDSFRSPVRGARIATTMRSSSERVEVVWDLWTAGPTCNTPPFTKALPDQPRAPELFGTLRTVPGPLARTRQVELVSRTEGSANYLEVTGAPTHYRTSQRSDFQGSGWQTTQVMTTRQAVSFVRPAPHEITGGDGTKRIYLQLKNDVGVSRTYQFQLDFLNLYTCRLAYLRAPNAMATTGLMQTEELTIIRGQSKTLNVAWPSANEGRLGYGMHLRRASNEGDHRVELTVGGGLIWDKVVLEPGAKQNFRADMKAVRCP